MVQAYLHEWREFTHEMKKLHEVDGIHYARQQDMVYLHDEIAKLKAKRLHDRRRTLENFFLGSDKSKKTAYFHEWKHFMHEMKREREVDGIHGVRESVAVRLEKAEALLRVLGGAIMDYEIGDAPQKGHQMEGEAQYLKHGLHNVLQETDAHYVPPLRHIPVNDMTGQYQEQNTVRAAGAPIQGQATVVTASAPNLPQPGTLMMPQVPSLVMSSSGIRPMQMTPSIASNRSVSPSLSFPRSLVA